MSNSKNIRIHRKTAEILDKLRTGDESYNSIIWRILEEFTPKIVNGLKYGQRAKQNVQ